MSDINILCGYECWGTDSWEGMCDVFCVVLGPEDAMGDCLKILCMEVLEFSSILLQKSILPCLFFRCGIVPLPI